MSFAGVVLDEMLCDFTTLPFVMALFNLIKLTAPLILIITFACLLCWALEVSISVAANSLHTAKLARVLVQAVETRQKKLGHQQVLLDDVLLTNFC